MSTKKKILKQSKNTLNLNKGKTINHMQKKNKNKTKTEIFSKEYILLFKRNDVFQCSGSKMYSAYVSRRILKSTTIIKMHYNIHITESKPVKLVWYQIEISFEDCCAVRARYWFESNLAWKVLRVFVGKKNLNVDLQSRNSEMHQKRGGQQVERCDCPPLLFFYETPCEYCVELWAPA